MKTTHLKKFIIVVLCTGMMFSISKVFTPIAAEVPDGSYMLHADGARLVNAKGHTVRLAGVNVPVPEQFVTEEVLARLKEALDGWKVNCIRLAITPDSWLQPDSARREEYRRLVDTCVAETASRGAYIILDNHKYVLPEKDSFDFWADVSVRYKNHPNVIFGLLNEPHNCTWDQWLNGTKEGEPIRFINSSGEPQVVESKGFQALADSIRRTGAKNLMTVSGLGSYWAFDLSKVTEGYALKDETGNGVMYETHAYMGFPQNYEDYIGVCAKQYPVYIGEFGPRANDVALINNETVEYFEHLFSFIEKYQLHFTPWSFHEVFNPCLLATNAPSFIPTEFGSLMKRYIAKTLADKPISLYGGRNYTGKSLVLYEGNYTQNDFKLSGFNLSEIQSVKTAESAYQYMLTFYSGPDYTGKSFVVFDRTADLKSLGLSFSPQSVKITRYIPVSVIRSDRADINGLSENVLKMTDGSMLTRWQKEMGESEERMVLTFQLDKPYLLSRIVLSHGEMSGQAAFSNTADFSVSVGTNNAVYTRLTDIKGNTSSQSVIRFEQRAVRYIRIIVTKGSMVDAKSVCLTELEAYGAEYDGDIADPIIISKVSGNPAPSPEPMETDSGSESVITETEMTEEPASETTASQPPEFTDPQPGESQTKTAQGHGNKNGSFVIWCSIAGVVLAAAGVAALVTLKKRRQKETG